MDNKFDSKFVAIINENGGPNTTQQEKAIQKSASIKMINFLLLERLFKELANLFI